MTALVKRNPIKRGGVNREYKGYWITQQSDGRYAIGNHSQVNTKSCYGYVWSLDEAFDYIENVCIPRFGDKENNKNIQSPLQTQRRNGANTRQRNGADNYYLIDENYHVIKKSRHYDRLVALSENIPDSGIVSELDYQVLTGQVSHEQAFALRFPETKRTPVERVAGIRINGVYRNGVLASDGLDDTDLYAQFKRETQSITMPLNDLHDFFHGRHYDKRGARIELDALTRIAMQYRDTELMRVVENVRMLLSKRNGVNTMKNKLSRHNKINRNGATALRIRNGAENESNILEAVENAENALGVEFNAVVMTSLEPAEIQDAIAEYCQNNEGLEDETTVVMDVADEYEDEGDDDSDDGLTWYRGEQMPVAELRELLDSNGRNDGEGEYLIYDVVIDGESHGSMLTDDATQEELNSKFNANYGYDLELEPFQELNFDGSYLDTITVTDENGGEIAELVFQEKVQNGNEQRNGVVSRFLNRNRAGRAYKRGLRHSQAAERDEEMQAQYEERTAHFNDNAPRRKKGKTSPLPIAGLTKHNGVNSIGGATKNQIDFLFRYIHSHGITRFYERYKNEFSDRLLKDISNVWRLSNEQPDVLADKYWNSNATEYVRPVRHNGATRTARQTVYVQPYERDSENDYPHEVSGYYRAPPLLASPTESKRTAIPRNAEAKTKRAAYWGKLKKQGYQVPKSLRNGVTGFWQNVWSIVPATIERNKWNIVNREGSPILDAKTRKAKTYTYPQALKVMQNWEVEETKAHNALNGR